MMKRLLIVCAAVALAGTAAAGTISITISQAARIHGDTLNVDVTVGNTGDEAAHSVTPVLRFGDKEVRGKGKTTLEPKPRRRDAHLAGGALGRAGGRTVWPSTTPTRTSTRSRRSSAAITAPRRPPRSPCPRSRSEDLGHGTLAVTVKNLTADRARRTSRCSCPTGSRRRPGARGQLDGWQEESVKVALTNRTALAGSRYPVFVTAEYDDGAVHTGGGRAECRLRGRGGFVLRPQCALAAYGRDRAGRGMAALDGLEDGTPRRRHAPRVAAARVSRGWTAAPGPGRPAPSASARAAPPISWPSGSRATCR